MLRLKQIGASPRLGLLLIVFSIFFLNGCASLEGPTEPHDPWERYNRSMTKFNNKLDKYVMRPVAKAYDFVTPNVVQKGITNFFGNMTDVVVLINDVLQLKIGQAASDLGRIVYNSTFGIAGLIDVATPMGLPKHNEDFGQTLGYWGVGPGPYLVLPFFGPSTVRDGFGYFTDFLVFDPSNQIKSLNTRAGITTLYFIDLRANYLGAEKMLEKASTDQYIFVREAYLQQRRSRVYDGEPPEEEFE